MPILESPVDLIKHPITHDFWIDESKNPLYKNFYDIFDGHHPGIDFNLPEGTPLRASLPGIVVRNEFHPGMGNVLAIRNGNINILYAHLSSPCVELGQIIRPKQLVAYSGNTGTATTDPHLHFELRDLTKTSLKESVSKPIFGEEIKNYTPSFNYIVNNSNTQKNIVNLAIRYFGLPSYSSFLRDNNLNLKEISFDSPLPSGQSVLIPSPKLETEF